MRKVAIDFVLNAGLPRPKPDASNQVRFLPLFSILLEFEKYIWRIREI